MFSSAAIRLADMETVFTCCPGRRPLGGTTNKSPGRQEMQRRRHAAGAKGITANIESSERSAGSTFSGLPIVNNRHTQAACKFAPCHGCCTIYGVRNGRCPQRLQIVNQFCIECIEKPLRNLSARALIVHRLCGSCRLGNQPCGAHGGLGVNSNRGLYMRNIYSFLRSKSGAAAAEYALILAIIGAGIALGIVILGADISSALTSAGSVISGFVY